MVEETGLILPLGQWILQGACCQMIVNGRRDECIVATKTEPFDPKGLVTHVEGSLKLMRIDVIDVLQLHGAWFYEDETS